MSVSTSKITTDPATVIAKTIHELTHLLRFGGIEETKREITVNDGICENRVDKKKGKTTKASAKELKAAEKDVEKYKTTLMITDKPILIGDWHYIEAKVVLFDNEKTDDFVMTTACAREPLEKTKMEAQQKSVQAQADQDAAKIKAETKLIEAEAEKAANELLNQSLSDEVLQKAWIEKWNGVVPTYYGGSDSGLMFNVGSGE